MTGCDCKKALAALEEYLRRELCEVEAEEIRAHLCECTHCSEELRVGQMLTAAVKRACGENAPDEVKGGGGGGGGGAGPGDAGAGRDPPQAQQGAAFTRVECDDAGVERDRAVLGEREHPRHIVGLFYGVTLC